MFAVATIEDSELWCGIERFAYGIRAGHQCNLDVRDYVNILFFNAVSSRKSNYTLQCSLISIVTSAEKGSCSSTSFIYAGGI